MNAQAKLTNRARFLANVLGVIYANKKMSGGSIARVTRGARHLSLGLRLRNPDELAKAIDVKMAEAIALATNSESVLAERRLGLVVYQFQLAPGYWEFYTRADLTSIEAVGLGEQREPVKFTFDDDPHALVAGTTGSGKTENIKSILVSLIERYTPEDIKIVMCDPNHMLTDFDNELHLALPIARTQNEQRQALQFVYQTLKHRKQNNIKDDHILCFVLDEATESLLTEDDLAMAKMIVKQGRGFKVFAIVGTQKPNQSDLPDIVDLLLNRYIGKVSNAGVSHLLTGHAGLQAHKLTGKGDFLHICNGGESVRFQVAMATQADFNRLERGEVSPVEVEVEPVIDLPELPEPTGPGRPRAELDIELLAGYFWLNPDKISVRNAQVYLNLGRTAHGLHNDTCRQFVSELRRLEKLNIKILPEYAEYRRQQGLLTQEVTI